MSALADLIAGRVTGPSRPAASPSVLVVNDPRGLAVSSVANDISVGRRALRRSVNERIRSVSGGPGSETIDVFCECGRVLCAERVRIPIDEFDEIVGAERPVVAPAHA